MLVLKNRAVSPQRAQAREMNNEFNAVSVTFEYRPILLLIILRKMKVLRTNSNHLFFCILTQTRAELCCYTRVRHFPGPAFSSLCSFLVRHFQVLQIQRPQPAT